MFFDIFDRADKNGDGKVDIWEAAEELYAYDSIMGTNISGFCPENDRTEPDDDLNIKEECDELYDNEYLGDIFDDEDSDGFDDEYDDCDEW